MTFHQLWCLCQAASLHLSPRVVTFVIRELLHSFPSIPLPYCTTTLHLRHSSPAMPLLTPVLLTSAVLILSSYTAGSSYTTSLNYTTPLIYVTPSQVYHYLATPGFPSYSSATYTILSYTLLQLYHPQLHHSPAEPLPSSCTPASGYYSTPALPLLYGCTDPPQSYHFTPPLPILFSSTTSSQFYHFFQVVFFHLQNLRSYTSPPHLYFPNYTTPSQLRPIFPWCHQSFPTYTTPP